MNDLMAKIANLSTGRIAIFGFLITLVYYMMVYDSGSSIVTEMDALNTQISDESGKKAETEKVLKKEEQVRAETALTAKGYEEVKAKIPIDFEAAELRQIVDQVRSETSLEMIDFKNMPKGNESNSSPEANLIEQVVSDIKFEGTYSQIANFVTKISEIEKIVKVGDFTIQVSNRKKTEGPVYKLAFDTKIIGYKQSPETKKTDKGAVKK